MDITEVRNLIIRGATQAGSHEPEDAAQDVLLRVVKNKHTLQHPAAYWLTAGKNEARIQARKRLKQPQRLGLWEVPVSDKALINAREILTHLYSNHRKDVLYILSIGEVATAYERVRRSRLRKRLSCCRL